MKKILTTIALGAGLMLFSAPAFAAQPAPVTINFNGHTLASDVDPVIQNNRTLVPVRAISESLGADVEWDAATRTVTIIKNDDIIKLVADKKATEINGQAGEDLDVPATILNQRTMVPVRFINEALGATVDWDNATRTVLIDFDETRDGMSAEEVLAKSNAEMTKVDSYQFAGAFDMNVQVQDKTQALPPQEITTGMKMTGGVKQSTNQAYFTMGMELFGQEMNTESYFDGTYSYVKVPGDSEWKKNPVALDPELIEQMKSQEPAEALKLLQEFGLISAFGNDAEVDGKDCYVIRVSLDQKQFMEKFSNLFGAMSGLSGADQAEFNQLLNSMKMYMSVKVYVDKTTFQMYSEAMDMTVYLDNDQASIKEVVTGNFNVTDLGKEITFPTIPDDVKTIEVPTAPVTPQAPAV